MLHCHLRGLWQILHENHRDKPRQRTRLSNRYHPDPWQFVFEEFALAQGRAPFLYRLCEVAVRHWDYNG